MVDTAQIVEIALANRNKTGCDVNSMGQVGFYTSCQDAGNWCADFAKWVWEQAGAEVSGLNSGSGSFAVYGVGLGSTPHVGDAVVFGYNNDPAAPYADHVAIVSEVSGSNIYSIGGNEGYAEGATAATAHVQLDGPYPAAHGNTAMGYPLSGFVSPAGGAEPPPTTSAIEDPDMSTQSSNGVVAISFKPGTVTQLQITTDPAAGALPLRVVLALNNGPWVQNGSGGTGVNATVYAVPNGYATYTLDSSHAAACGGVIIESQDSNRVFSVVGF